MLEGVGGATILRHAPRFSLTLETTSSVVALVLAALAGPLVSASIGVSSLYLGHIVPAPQLRTTWTAWWIGDMVGAVIVTPLILVWIRKPEARFRQHWLELVAVTAALIVISLLTFFGDHVALFATPFHQTNILIAVLCWAALRFGQRGAATAAVFVSAMAVALRRSATVHLSRKC